MNIVFVGDRPSRKNKDPNVPFVGTKSYKQLLDWIYKMNINISDVTLINSGDLFDYLSDTKKFGSLFVALGKNARNTIEDIQIGMIYSFGFSELRAERRTSKLNYFYLPHPSGRNRTLNNKKLIDQKLKECEKWIRNA